MDWFGLSKVARYGTDRPMDQADEQARNTFTPYGTQKSPEELGPDRSRPFDQGFGLGDTRDFVTQYNEMVHDTALDEMMDGQHTADPANREPPHDTVTDDALDHSSGLGPSSGELHSPLGESAQTMRRATEFYKDNKDGRLPNGTTMPSPKQNPVRRKPANGIGRFASVGGPIEMAVLRIMKGG